MKIVYPYKPIDAIYDQPFSLKIYKRVLTIEYLSVYVYNNDICRTCKVYLCHPLRGFFLLPGHLGGSIEHCS
jgi:hypothetical protein